MKGKMAVADGSRIDPSQGGEWPDLGRVGLKTLAQALVPGTFGKCGP